MPSWHNLLQVPETALAEMSQLSALLSDALDIADETSQNEQDFVQVRSKGKRTRNYPKINSETIRPVKKTINPRHTFILPVRWKIVFLNSKLIALGNFQSTMTSLSDPKTIVQENVWWTPQIYNLFFRTFPLQQKTLRQEPNINPVL